MNKVELIGQVSESTGMSKKDIEAVVNSVLQTIIDTVASGNEVSLAGFGKFEKHHRNERMGHDPKHDVPIKIKATDAPKFKPAKAFKESVK